MATLKEILKELATQHGRGVNKQLSQYLGTSEANISRYLSMSPTNININMPNGMFEKVAKFFNIDEMILIRADTRLSNVNQVLNNQENTINPDSVIAVPIIHAMAGCGASGMLEDLQLEDDKMLIDTRFFPDDIVSKNIAIIRVVGDSMDPFLEENDWAIIQLRNGHEISYSDSVYLVAHGNNVQIKRCHFHADGGCSLISDNHLYPKETAYAGDWDVVGKVIGRIKMSSFMKFK